MLKKVDNLTRDVTRTESMKVPDQKFGFKIPSVSFKTEQ